MLSTKIKFLLQIIYKILNIVFKLPFFDVDIKQLRVERNNINWFLDLSEGIDLSIFIFGSSEKNLSKLKKLLDDSKDLIFIDIGANIGSTSLSLAQLFKFSKISSFEPTFFAYKKFQTNLELNPNLAKRINLQNYLISNGKRLKFIQVGNLIGLIPIGINFILVPPKIYKQFYKIR